MMLVLCCLGHCWEWRPARESAFNGSGIALIEETFSSSP